ncbi:hypothetical protein JFL43_19690 [Viridibacillus sp. YIM B01967]|uniref:Uncharacterized protein n=1 Tax=Viridibacillus soli TaxID=2798301 RepID=A0ABS1HC75_9BACL|nr:hypothetical protein [Viridibacillus soli]
MNKISFSSITIGVEPIVCPGEYSAYIWMATSPSATVIPSSNAAYWKVTSVASLEGSQ